MTGEVNAEIDLADAGDAPELVPAEVWASFRGHVERLAPLIAPDDLAGLPFYVVSLSDMPATFRGAGEVLGLFSHDLDVIARNADAIEWRGRGPAILINAQRYWRLAGDIAGNLAEARYGQLRQAPPSQRDLFTMWATETALHELAHLFEYDTYRGEELLPQLSAQLTADHAEITSGRRRECGPTAAVPFRHHEWPFVRMVMHVAHRARRGGVEVAPDRIYSATSYGLSSAEAYATTLGDEPERMAGAPFSEIRPTLPPQAFMDLWDADVDRWRAAVECTDTNSGCVACAAHRFIIPISC